MAVGDAQMGPAVSGVQAFTADLFRRLATTPGNLVCSPYSVAVALAMTRNGARERTAEEMDRVLHSAGPRRINAGMNALLRRLEGRAGTHRRLTGDQNRLVLDAANSMWGQRGTRWEQPFLDALARHYGTGMRLVDYRADPERAAGLINGWTSQATRDRIPRLIPPGVLDALTRLVLVNAISFKAAWLEPFDESLTRRRAFTTSDGSSVEVDMMSEDLHHAAFASGEGWRAARLPYVGGEIALAVVVPEPGTSLADVEASLDGPVLARILTGFRPEPVIRVQMPRWTFRVRARLNDHLSSLGMPTAFDPRAADFTGLTSQEQLYISHVLHEAFIAVDEAGTEAAAATAVVVRTTSAQPKPPVTLTADRPFLFALFDVPTATPSSSAGSATPRSRPGSPARESDGSHRRIRRAETRSSVRLLGHAELVALGISQDEPCLPELVASHRGEASRTQGLQAPDLLFDVSHEQIQMHPVLHRLRLRHLLQGQRDPVTAQGDVSVLDRAFDLEPSRAPPELGHHVQVAAVQSELDAHRTIILRRPFAAPNAAAVPIRAERSQISTEPVGITAPSCE